MTTHRDRWRTEVIRSSAISDSVRVLLLVMADEMTDKGFISVPRSKLAKQLNRTERRVTERLNQARAAGYLDVVNTGRPGLTARYQAILPEADGARVRTIRKGAHVRPMKDADVRTKLGVRKLVPAGMRTSAPHQDAQHGADGGPATARVPNATGKTNDAPTDGMTALDVARATGCYSCQRISAFDPVALPCPDHREAS